MNFAEALQTLNKMGQVTLDFYEPDTKNPKLYHVTHSIKNDQGESVAKLTLPIELDREHIISNYLDSFSNGLDQESLRGDLNDFFNDPGQVKWFFSHNTFDLLAHLGKYRGTEEDDWHAIARIMHERHCLNSAPYGI